MLRRSSQGKLGPLVNEERKKINDNSEITRTDLTLGICPSSSLQGQSPALHQQLKARALLPLVRVLQNPSYLFFNFYTHFVSQILWFGFEVGFISAH